MSVCILNSCSQSFAGTTSPAGEVDKPSRTSLASPPRTGVNLATNATGTMWSYRKASASAGHVE